MKIFISWSGPRSNHIAKAFDEWLPNVLQSVKTFMSSNSIGKGERGLKVIADALENTSFGLVCLTPENQEKRWIQFESGAISKMSNAILCPFLYEMQPADVLQPLASFQLTVNTEEEIFKLCEKINSRLEGNSVTYVRLKKSFDKWYPELAEQLAKTPPAGEDEIVDKRTENDKIDELLTIVRSLQIPRVPAETASKEQAVPLVQMDFFVLDFLRRILDNRSIKQDEAMKHAGYAEALEYGLAKVTNRGKGPIVVLTDQAKRWLSER